MVILMGLGNPGPSYAATRHNIGFRILDILARDHRLAFSKREALCLAAHGRIASGDVLLVKPQTFMNRSGEAADKLRSLHAAALEEFLVLYDDLDLPFGQLRLRASGGPGTHNGMRSIVEHWGGGQFPRLRFGIGPVRGDAADFVLSPFDDDENGRLPDLLDRAARGVERFLTEGPERAMGWINPRPDPADLET